MTVYQNLGRDSGVRAYEAAAQRISVLFADGSVYEYTWAVTGRTEVEQMKQLAAAGKGLCTFISQHVGSNYARKR